MFNVGNVYIIRHFLVEVLSCYKWLKFLVVIGISFWKEKKIDNIEPHKSTNMIQRIMRSTTWLNIKYIEVVYYNNNATHDN